MPCHVFFLHHIIDNFLFLLASCNIFIFSFAIIYEKMWQAKFDSVLATNRCCCCCEGDNNEALLLSLKCLGFLTLMIEKVLLLFLQPLNIAEVSNEFFLGRKCTLRYHHVSPLTSTFIIFIVSCINLLFKRVANNNFMSKFSSLFKRFEFQEKSINL